MATKFSDLFFAFSANARARSIYLHYMCNVNVVTRQYLIFFSSIFSQFILRPALALSNDFVDLTLTSGDAIFR